MQINTLDILNLIFQVQFLEIEIEEDIFVGMPFVFLSNGKWLKNKGTDFYIEFDSRSKQVQKVSLSFPTMISCILSFIIILH